MRTTCDSIRKNPTISSSRAERAGREKGVSEAVWDSNRYACAYVTRNALSTRTDPKKTQDSRVDRLGNSLEVLHEHPEYHRYVCIDIAA